MKHYYEIMAGCIVVAYLVVLVLVSVIASKLVTGADLKQHCGVRVDTVTVYLATSEADSLYWEGYLVGLLAGVKAEAKKWEGMLKATP